MTLTIILALLAIILFISKRWIDNSDISRIADILTIILFIASFAQLPGLFPSPEELHELTNTNSESVTNGGKSISGNPKDFFPELSQFPQHLELISDISYSNRDISDGKEDSSEYLATLESYGRIISHVYFLQTIDKCDSQEDISNVHIQVVMYKDSTGATQFFQSYYGQSNDPQLNSSQSFGEESIINYYPSNYEDPKIFWLCDDLVGIGIAYRYKNIIVSISVDGFDGRISKEDLMSEAVKFANIIEINLIANDS